MSHSAVASSAPSRATERTGHRRGGGQGAGEEAVRSRPAGSTLRIVGYVVQVVQAPTPLLLPLLRSALQGELLAVVLLDPQREWSLTELAARVGASVSTAQREMTRAEQAGVVTSRRLGNTRLVRAQPSPLTEPLTELLLRSFGPPQVIAEEFIDVSGVEGLYVFGSWAARYAGVSGRAPADLDVLVIGSPDRDALEEAAERAGHRLAREVNVTVRSRDWWLAGDDGFRVEVTSRPLVTLLAVAGG